MPKTSHPTTLKNQLFHDVFNSSPIGIAVETLEGRPLFVNPALCSMLGFTAEEMRHKHCVDFSPPEEAEKDWALFQQLQKGLINHYQIEKRYFRRDGSLLWGLLSLSLLDTRPSPLVVAMVQDITTKKNAEEAQSRYAAIVESSEDAIVSKTLDGVIASWNPGAQRLYGYAEHEVIGKPISILVPPELVDEHIAILKRLHVGERIAHFETRRITKAGKKIDVALSLAPIKDSAGKITGLSGIARDVSERKRQEAALLASEERLRLAQRVAGIGTFEKDVRTGVITSTTELEAMYGLPPGAFEETSISFFEKRIHPDDRERVIGLDKKAMATGEPTKAEWRVVWPDGSVHWIAGCWQVFMDESGTPARMIGVNTDISERKRADEALLAANRTLQDQSAVLKAREDLLQVFVKNVPAAVAMFDRDMHYLQVSDRWCTDYSVNSSQILGQSHYDVFPDLPERWKEAHRRALHGETLRADEDCWEHAGTTRWSRWELRPWQTPEGTPGGILIFSEDVTRRKQMEEVLSGMSRKLIDAQEKERTRIGRELHDDISQRLALLALELQQLHEDPSGLQGHLRELLNRIVEIADDVQGLSHDLHSSKLEYLGIVAGIRSWCKEFAERHRMKIDFRSDVSSTLPLELGLTLFRVVQEALHNAMKHSGVRQAEVQIREESNGIHLLISDSGRGFDTHEATKGRGLGLTSMRERVRLLNGTITIDSKPMRGTRVRVLLPIESRISSRAAV